MTHNGDLRIYSETHDVVLRVENQSYYLEKEVLREKCPYFNAMFSGKFAEDTQEEVVIEIITAKAMSFILNYLYFDEIDLMNLDCVPEYLEASMFFQLQNLVNAIEKLLLVRLNKYTWSKILHISSKYDLINVEKKSRCFGLYNFKNVKACIENIDSLELLHWYLSHMYLNTIDEYEVFEFGCHWLTLNQSESIDCPNSGILVVLSCLCYKNLDENSFKKILKHKLVQNCDIAKKVVEIVMILLSANSSLCLPILEDFRKRHISMSDEVFDLVCGFILPAKERSHLEQPCVIRKRNDSILKRFDPKKYKLVDWLKITSKDCWGHNVLVWNGFNIIVIFGETKMGKNVWNTDICSFNILEEKLTILNKIPVVARRHAGAVIHEDFLYIVGGLNSKRILLSSVLKYDLKKDVWETLPSLPECCQSPSVAFHKGEMYASAEMVYVLRDNEWKLLFKTTMLHNAMISYKDSLYFAHNWKNVVSMWNSNSTIDMLRANEVTFTTAKYNVTCMCRVGRHVYLLTESDHFHQYTYMIERCNLDDTDTFGTDILMESIAGRDYSYNTSECFPVPDINIDDVSINDYGKKWFRGNGNGHFSAVVEKLFYGNTNNPDPGNSTSAFVNCGKKWFQENGHIRSSIDVEEPSCSNASPLIQGDGFCTSVSQDERWFQKNGHGNSSFDTEKPSCSNISHPGPD